MNTPRHVLSLLLLAACSLVTVTAQAGIYKWVDKNGNTVYSQNPPQTGQYQSIQAPSAPPSNTTGNPAVDNAKKVIESGVVSEHKNAEVEKLTKQNDAIRAQNCKGAKANLQTFQVYRRIKQADGTVVRLSDTERQKKIDEMKQAIKEFCN